MIMLLNKEEEQQIILENQKLVYHMIKKTGVTPASCDYDDLFQIGIIGLLNAIRSFDESKGYAFSSYACRCIENELSINYKKSKKYEKDISLNTPIYEGKEGKEITLEDSIENPWSDFDLRIADKEYLAQIISIILNKLKSKDRIVILFKMANMNLSDIGRFFNITRERISKINQRTISNIKRVYDNHLPYNEVFKFLILENYYQISFNLKDIKNMGDREDESESFLNDLKVLINEPDIRIELVENRIVIKAPREAESFYFFGIIIQAIDKFEETDKDDSLIGLDKLSVISEDNNSDGKNINKRRTVINYILCLKSFSVKDLIKAFPELSRNDISNALNWLKRKGLITLVSRGKYVVN